MKTQSRCEDPLQKEWEALDRQICRSSGFTDAQLGALYDRVGHLPAVDCPALPPDRRAIVASRLRAVSMAAVVAVFVFLLPLPKAMATESDADRAASVEAVSMMLTQVKM